jgi:hypothetical protein
VRFAENVARIQRERHCPVLVRGKNFLIPTLEAAGVRLTLANGDEFAQASADLATAVETGEIVHGGYPELDAAVVIAQWKQLDNRRNFDARKGDISALEAVSLAFRASRTSQRVPRIYNWSDPEED